jgi:hypothetical protein
MKYFVDRKNIVGFRSNFTRFAVGKSFEEFSDKNEKTYGWKPLIFNGFL